MSKNGTDGNQSGSQVAAELAGAVIRDAWGLDPEVTYLNHGSFGACPKAVLKAQKRLRDQLEREPVRFFIEDYLPLLDQARESLAAFVGARVEDLVFVTNATTGVSTVVRSLHFEPGDELLTTNHAYPACRAALDAEAARHGARVVVADVPFPIQSPDQVVKAVMAGVTAKTRLVLLDHVTSQTGLIFPVERLVALLAERGIDTLVDGAHAPGMLAIDVGELGAAYYTGNCHKWMCAPKGAAFLVVRPDRQSRIRPLTTSHGAHLPLWERPPLWRLFDWTGTHDPTAWLCVPEAIRVVGSLVPGGWPEVRHHNLSLVLEGRRILCKALGIDLPAPNPMLGSLASIPIGETPNPPLSSPFEMEALQRALLGRFSVQVPVFPWPRHPQRCVRISAQLYNSKAQYQLLATSLQILLAQGV